MSDTSETGAATGAEDVGAAAGWDAGLMLSPCRELSMRLMRVAFCGSDDGMPSRDSSSPLLTSISAPVRLRLESARCR